MSHLFKQGYIYGLDGLRAIAALAVFGVHFNQIVQIDQRIGPFDVYKLLANGDHGVSLFFTLSGFLLGLPFWRSIVFREPLPGLKIYAIRRTARIIPAYYIALTTLIIVGNLWKVPGSLADILLHYTFLFNYTEFSFFSINPPFWTLAVEVQFYMLLPCVFLLVRRMTVWKSLVTILALGLAAHGVHIWLTNSISHIVPWPFHAGLKWIRPYGAVISHSLLAHLPHFLMGVIAGRLYLQINEYEKFRSKTIHISSESAFWISFIATVILLSTDLGDKLQFPYGRYSFPLVPILLTIMILSTPTSRMAKRWLDSLPLRLLGAISYGIYIYHLPCLNLTDRYMGKFGMDASHHWVLFGLIGFFITILIATVSFVAIEAPVLSLARRFKKLRQTDRGNT